MNQLEAEEYLRQRLSPKPGDPSYLHHSDLLIAIRTLIPMGVSRVLDFGCGGSPYRSLFGTCVYHRADLANGSSNLDFQYGHDSRLSSEAADYDCVLSTQVLEHVTNPDFYLRECHRVLRPGGKLLLTTHGLFKDHACPYDFWRWTASGLMRVVEDAGFEIETIKKLTTGPRYILETAEPEFQRLRFMRCGIYGYALTNGIRVIRRLGMARLHRAADRSFHAHRMVDANEDGHDAYVAIALLARSRET
jgi:SAM-dependent methyltransferase